MTAPPSARPEARRVERTIVLAAPVDAVWQALTDATELTRWFPMRARVEPGAGGSIHLQWDETYDAESRIEVWEPNRHLRLGFPHHPPVLLATDYYLQSEKGGTVLRVVTSGFGEGADWDEWFGGVSAGWDYELRGLKHYLEHHRGRDRVVASARAPFTRNRAEVWERLTGPGGWLDGTGLSGTVLLKTAPTQLVMTVDQLNNAILRVEVEMGRHVIAWMATYGVPSDAVNAVQRGWRHSLPLAVDSEQ